MSHSVPPQTNIIKFPLTLRVKTYFTSIHLPNYFTNDRMQHKINFYSCGPPHMANQKQDDQLEHTYSSYVMIRDVTLKTCQRRWMIGRRGERGSGISVLAARHDDDDSWSEFIFLLLDTLQYVHCTMYS